MRPSATDPAFLVITPGCHGNVGAKRDGGCCFETEESLVPLLFYFMLCEKHCEFQFLFISNIKNLLQI